MTTSRVFPESLRESTGGGPDFPGSSGDRERGKFRPSGSPRLTAIAVVGDDGRPVVKSAEELLGEILLWQKATVAALALLNDGAAFSVDDALREANKF